MFTYYLTGPALKDGAFSNRVKLGLEQEMSAVVTVGEVHIGGDNPIVLIAGPCVIESRDTALQTAEEIKEVAEREKIPYIFKSSYDKANRSSFKSFRGPGLDEGLKILEAVKRQVGVPILSDVHRVEEVEPASEVLDILQIPAFLCRQTDLVMAAGRSQKPVNVKKGQFLAPWDVRNIIEKILETGNRNILLTERGTSFGYNNLVADMRSLVTMRAMGFPVVFDATHSVQLPGGEGNVSGGKSEFVPYLARAAVAVGIDALFLEAHPRPEEALCDGPNMLSIAQLPQLLSHVKEIDRILKEKT